MTEQDEPVRRETNTNDQENRGHSNHRGVSRGSGWGNRVKGIYHGVTVLITPANISTGKQIKTMHKRTQLLSESNGVPGTRNFKNNLIKTHLSMELLEKDDTPTGEPEERMIETAISVEGKEVRI